MLGKSPILDSADCRNFKCDGSEAAANLVVEDNTAPTVRKLAQVR